MLNLPSLNLSSIFKPVQHGRYGTIMIRKDNKKDGKHAAEVNTDIQMPRLYRPDGVLFPRTGIFKTIAVSVI